MKGIRLEFSNAWMHLKLSFEKKSISMNFGSIMERDEKRFVYRIRCSSDENNDLERIEEGIGVSCDSEYRWLRLEVPFSLLWWFHHLKRLFKILIVSNEREWKKDEVWALWGVIWTRNEWDMAEERFGGEGFREREELQTSEFEYIGAGTRCNRLHKYGNRLPESNIARNSCL